MMRTKLYSLVSKLNQMHLLHRIYIQKASAAHGLYKGQMPLLEFLLEHNGCTQREIAQWLQVTPPSVATSIKRLQKAGMLQKVTDSNDLRLSRITITPLGQKTVEACRTDFDQVDTRMMYGFSKEECEQLESYVQRMIDNLSTEEFRDMSFHSLLQTMKKLQQLPPE